MVHHKEKRIVPQKSAPEVSRLDIFDCSSLFHLTERARNNLPNSPGTISNEAINPPSFNYREAFEVLRKSREDIGFQPAQNTLAIATIDPESDGQSRFVTALVRMEILVEAVDFRHATTTLPLEGENDQTSRRYITSLAPNITYVLGLLAARPSPEVVVVTRSFEVFNPLLDFVRRGGKAAIAFFRRFLDPRFVGVGGLFDPDSRIEFVDFEDESQRLMGLDLGAVSAGKRPSADGISRL